MAMDVQESVWSQVPNENSDHQPGHYFHTSRWWWRPLTNYVCHVAPTIARHCTHWWSTQGEGLNAEQALELAKKLREEHASGRLAQYAREYNERLNTLPLQDCSACAGTGQRLSGPPNGPGDPACETCRGLGKTKHRECSYHFTEENVLNFAHFLEHCEGFEFF